MKIAFDVKGTLDGHKKVEIRHILRELYAAGHEIYIWSSLFSYAVKEVKYWEQRDVKCEALDKYSTYEAKERNMPIMDVAFEDDRTQYYLAVKRMIFVDEVPNNAAEFANALIESLKIV